MIVNGRGSLPKAHTSALTRVRWCVEDAWSPKQLLRASALALETLRRLRGGLDPPGTRAGMS